MSNLPKHPAPPPPAPAVKVLSGVGGGFQDGKIDVPDPNRPGWRIFVDAKPNAQGDLEPISWRYQGIFGQMSDAALIGVGGAAAVVLLAVLTRR